MESLYYSTAFVKKDEKNILRDDFFGQIRKYMAQ